MEKNLKRVFTEVDELDTLHQTLNKVKSIMSLTFHTMAQEKTEGGYHRITPTQFDALDLVDDQLAELTKAIEAKIRAIQDICREEPADA